MIKLNLGCGYNKKDGFINIDNREFLFPDLVSDITEGIPFQENTADEVHAKDFLEHIPVGRTVFVIEEIFRVLKPNCIFYSLTPSTDGRGAFQDPTHLSFWNKNSWWYYTVDEYRKLYGIKAKFSGEIKDLYTDRNNNIIHTSAILRAIK